MTAEEYATYPDSIEVREVRVHMIGYNLIRQLMCEAAMTVNVQPWQIRFKSTMQTLNEMLPILSNWPLLKRLALAPFRRSLTARVLHEAYCRQPARQIRAASGQTTT